MNLPNPSAIELSAAIVFAIAVVHTFSTRYFERLAHRYPRHGGIFHLLGEVEVVFGFWAMALMLIMLAVSGRQAATAYLDARDFTEPMFVFAIMVIAGTRPVMVFAEASVRLVVRYLPLPQGMGMYFSVLAFVPLLGSFITEPAAMTLAALMLRDTLFTRAISTRLKYATVAVLFVNISIGGTLTPFAAPPVLMVAGKWGWDIWFMVANFGWKAAVAVALNAAAVMLLFRNEIGHVGKKPATAQPATPLAVIVVHLFFLAAVVTFAHHPAVFMALFLFFLGFTTAYQTWQHPLILREALLVAFFLAGLVVLGGLQHWWLQPMLMSMDADAVFFGATALTAITDNAALTYLGSLVDGLTADFKIALVGGAVAGGGLTVIANAPNPAGAAILRGRFTDNAIHPVGLLVSALPPTFVAILAFRVL